MVYFPPTGVDWPFPVQREYMILQLSPVAMVKHLNDPKLLSDLSAIRTRKYLAIFSHFLEEPSLEKPWHLAELYILYEVRSPETPPAEYEQQHPHTEAAAVENLAEQELNAERELTQAAKTTFPSSPLKPTYALQSVYARIRTRLCDLPRDAPHLVARDDEHWIHMFHTMTRAADYKADLDFALECRRSFVKRVEDPATQPVQPAGERDAPWGEAEQPAVYLLPHFECSFDIGQPTAPGRLWEAEHAEIVSLLRAAVPSIPERGRIPIMWTWGLEDDRGERAHFVEHPRSESPMTEMRNHAWGRHTDQDADEQEKRPEYRPPLWRRAIWGFFRVLDNCVPKPAPPKHVPPPKEYVDKVDEPTDSIYVEAPGAQLEGDAKVAVPPVEKSKQQSKRHSFLPVTARRYKQSPEFIDKPFIPFADSYKVEKKEERDEYERERYEWM